MYLTRMSTYIAIACAIAAAPACNSTSRDNATGSSDSERTQPTATSADTQNGDRGKTSITVAGCLQKGDGNTLILTRVNEPAQSVGTGGNSGGAAVEREQLRMAAGSYRVDPPADARADTLVGKEVRVVGTVTEDADLPRPSAGNERRGNGADLSKSDLTRIEAASITATNDVCQGSESTPTGGPARR
jgi:hypothetical protein